MNMFETHCKKFSKSIGEELSKMEINDLTRNLATRANIKAIIQPVENFGYDLDCTAAIYNLQKKIIADTNDLMVTACTDIITNSGIDSKYIVFLNKENIIKAFQEWCETHGKVEPNTPWDLSFLEDD